MIAKFLERVLKRKASDGRTGALPHDEIHSILVIEMTRLGDVLTMLPAIQLMQRNFSSSGIHLLVDERYAKLLEDLELDARIHGIRDSSTAAWFVSGLVRMRRNRFDLACSMSPAKRNVLLTLASRSRFKAGYLTYTNSHIHFLTESKIGSLGFGIQKSLTYGREHLEERALKVCDALGAIGETGKKPLRLKKTVLDRVTARLQGSEFPFTRPFVAIHPYSGWEFKSWKIGNFCRIANFIVESLGYDVVFVCEKQESQALEIARNLLHNRGGVHFFPSTDLTETAVMLHSATLFLGNDSGPLHLAAALGVKVVGLYGPAPPELTAPRTGNGFFLYEKVACSPCGQVTCIRPDNPCMDLISTEEVCATVKKALAAPPKGTAVDNVKS